MRISSSWTHQAAVSAMLNQQANVQQTQMQLSTGKKFLTPSDDPIAAARVLDLNQSLKQTEQFQSNINYARDRLTLEEGVLESATEILQRIHEIGIQGINGTTTATNRTNIATEMDLLNKQLVNLANTKNANGEFMFAGFKSNTQPFSKDVSNPGAFNYAGDSNSRTIQIDASGQVADGDPGNNVFGIPTGPSPASVPAAGSIMNVFEAIDKFATDLRNNAPTKASLDDISRSLDRVMTVRASVGTRLNVLDKQEVIHSDAVLNTQSLLSNTQDLDYAEAITRLNQQTVALQAAQQTFAQVKKLSLFNYIN